MFNPTRDQVRLFFCDTWNKYRTRFPLEGLEVTALDVILQHPEYHDFLTRTQAALNAEFVPESNQTNPFLHLSLHLAIEEQLAIDQPKGIRAAYEKMLARVDCHTAKHALLECLGEIVWRAQRDQTEPDGNAYLECIFRKGTTNR